MIQNHPTRKKNSTLAHARAGKDTSSPLKHSRIDRHHDDETRDDEREGHEGDQENGAPAGREFATDDPVLHTSANLFLCIASRPDVAPDHRLPPAPLPSPSHHG